MEDCESIHQLNVNEMGYEITPDETKDLASLDESLLDGTTSISDILGGKSITKVKSNTPISGKSKISGSSSKVIPLAAGLTAAAAAGIGAKAYLDSRDREDENEEENEDIRKRKEEVEKKERRYIVP